MKLQRPRGSGRNRRARRRPRFLDELRLPPPPPLSNVLDPAALAPVAIRADHVSHRAMYRAGQERLQLAGQSRRSTLGPADAGLRLRVEAAKPMTNCRRTAVQRAGNLADGRAALDEGPELLLVDASASCVPTA